MRRRSPSRRASAVRATASGQSRGRRCCFCRRAAAFAWVSGVRAESVLALGRPLPLLQAPHNPLFVGKHPSKASQPPCMRTLQRCAPWQLVFAPAACGEPVCGDAPSPTCCACAHVWQLLSTGWHRLTLSVQSCVGASPRGKCGKHKAALALSDGVTAPDSQLMPRLNA